MSKFIFLAFCFLSFSFLAKDLKEGMPTYQVLSDEVDDKISAGMYVVEGKIVYAEQPNNLVKNVKIQIHQSKEAVSKNGYFELTIPVTSKYVAFSNKKIEETYYENAAPKEKRRIKVIVYASRYSDRVKVVAEKPVIYGYCDSLIKLSICLKSKGSLSFTYPPIEENSAWNVWLYKNEFAGRDGSLYPYLFWDAELLFGLDNFTDGYVVAKDSIISFLEKTLAALNLNAREKTDFITYWGPRLTKTDFVFLRFYTQESCNVFAEYEINPKPEGFNRLYIVFSSLKTESQMESLKSLSPQKLSPFNRAGFELFEWGGVELPENQFLKEL